MKKQLCMIVATVFVVLGMASAFSVEAQWQGVARQVVKQGVKQLGKAVGKNWLNRGAEEKCLFGPFMCAKVANAPGPVQRLGPVQPRGPQRPVQPRGPQRPASPRR